MEDKKKKEITWYNDGSKVVNLIILTIFLIIIFSQSFVTTHEFSLTLFGSIINHNSVYLFVLIYFVLLKFNVGKKYFNYLNLLLIFIYFITTITSFLTLIQAFSLNTALEFTINFVLLTYLFHTMLRGTRVWKEFKLSNSPFNEITNENQFYIVIMLSVVILIVDLISTVELRGIVISLLDAGFIILFGRYIFLYRKYLDDKKIDSKNKGNFDDVKKVIDETVDKAQDKVQDVLDKTEIDEKIVEVAGMVADEAKEVKDTAVEFVKDNVVDVKKEEKPKKKTSTKKPTTKTTTTKKKGEKK